MCTLQQFVASAAVVGASKRGARSALASFDAYLANFNNREIPDALRSVNHMLKFIQLEGSVRNQLDIAIKIRRGNKKGRIFFTDAT